MCLTVGRPNGLLAHMIQFAVDSKGDGTMSGTDDIRIVSRRHALLGATATGAALYASTAKGQASAALIDTSMRPQKASGAEHIVVYRNNAEFCGWPYYCGLWKTADGSLVAGFKRIPSNYQVYADVDHNQLTRNAGHICIIRSADNGRSWDAASVQPIFDMATKEEKDLPGGSAADWSLDAPIDFTSRDSLIMGGGIPGLFSPNARAWMRASTDGGRSWRRPTLLPSYDLPSLSLPGSSMYATRADGVHLLGMQTSAPGVLSPRPLIYASSDGRSWQFLSFMTEEKPASPYYRGSSPFSPAPHFYPRPTVLKDGRVIASLRYQRDPRNVIWTEIMESLDGGRNWHFLSRVNDWGAPGDLVPMADGRIVCVYGYRIAPQGIRYRVSTDGGRRWGREMILRDDGGSWDLGYPRVIEIAPGTLLTTYYMNLKNDPVQVNGGVRHIAATIFRP
jgi:hypothetical protein